MGFGVHQLSRIPRSPQGRDAWIAGRFDVVVSPALLEEIADVLTRPLPDCLVLGWVSSGEPLHAVVAIDLERDRIFVVTVYRPSQEEWEDDRRTRKK